MQCESSTVKGTRCKNKVIKNECFCRVHVNKPLTTSRKFIMRLATLVHDLAEDISNKIGSVESATVPVCTCTYCEIELTKDNRSRDHVVRLVQNSRISPLTNLSNVTVPCCKTCNSKQIGQKNQPQGEVSVRYKLDCEDELNEYLDRLKHIMLEIDSLVQKSKLIELEF